MSLKEYIEKNLFSENLLPGFPFLIGSWNGHVILADGGLYQKDFELLKICINDITHDTFISCCSTTFYQTNANWLSEWKVPVDWTQFNKLIDDYSFVSYSGMYFLGSSEKWGGIIIEGMFAILGGEADFIKRFEELSGGYLTLKHTFEKQCLFDEDSLQKACIYKEPFFIELREAFYL